jgi:hypothetical protein
MTPALLFLLFSCTSSEDDSAVDPCTLDSDNDRLGDCEEVNRWHTDPNKADTDEDGLDDWDEVKTYDTDPNDSDTDDDTYEDGDEVNALGTSPTNKYSHPYTGDYNIGACAEYPDKATAHPTGSRVVSTGSGGSVKVPIYLPGDTVQNFTLIDQYGEMVDLYSFCGKNVDLLFFQFNHISGPAQYAALSCWIQDFKNVHEYYRDYGYELIVVLTQNNETELPTTEDVAAVAAMLGFNDNPVLASNDESISSFHAWFEKDFHEPTLVHLGPELNVLSVDNDDCAGTDRDPCPYMGDAVPKGQCWPEGPDDDCEPMDYKASSGPYCACPYPACKSYEWICELYGLECLTIWED